MQLGSKIGAYEVIAKVGEGGMGEVYRARDVDLKRDVAIKVLPEAFAQDNDRIARFRREAEVLAGLNHPNIAAIYGLEKSGASVGLVLEYIPGDTLADRLRHGPMPLDEALPIARQIADALGVAHERGVVHRDLKPANIKVTPDGTVKVLDFGLAKAFDTDDPYAAPSVSHVATLTSPAMTRAGVILGTAAYMAPEQARGKPVDKRADIWAFGVVLFEMLSGRRMFSGDEVSDTLAFVLTKEPEWATLPANTPPALRRLLQRCLQKDRNKRLADIADARFEIDEALQAPSVDASSTSTQPVPAGSSTWTRYLPWAVAILGLAGTATTLAMWAPWRPVAMPMPMRFETPLGASVAMGTLTGSGVALSPDGSTLAFIGTTAPDDPAIRAQVYVRNLSGLAATALVGTEGATRPFFSPDGQSIGFFAGGQLKRVAPSGGAVVTICPAAGGARGASWGEDGHIVFALGNSRGLLRVAAMGGQPEQLTTQTEGEGGHGWPHVLPGARAVLYAIASTARFGDATIMVKPLPDGEPVVLHRGGYFPQYVDTGHLLFMSGGTLFAARFDPGALRLTGSPVPALDQIRSDEITGATMLALSLTGTVTFAAAGNSMQATGGPMLWLERTGPLRPIRINPAMWATPRFSPDGQRVAMTISDGRQTDIWVYDWQRDTLTRITADPAADASPVWMPDGQRLIFGSARADRRSHLFLQRADGTGSAEQLTEGSRPELPDDVDPSGRFLVYHDGDPTGGAQRIMALPIDGLGSPGWKAGAPRELIGGNYIAAFPKFSRDGRWIAYTSLESGRFQIYVLPFPGPGTRVQVSSDGGSVANWSPLGNELYYAFGGPRVLMMRVPYKVAGDTFVPSKPEPWSETFFSSSTPFGVYGPGLDLHPDGKRFLVAAPVQPLADNPGQSQLVFVLNFFSTLRGPGY